MLLCLQKALWICFLCLMAGLLVVRGACHAGYPFVLALAAVMAAIFFWAADALRVLQRPQALEWPLRAGYALFFVLLCVFGLLALPSPSFRPCGCVRLCSRRAGRFCAERRLCRLFHLLLQQSFFCFLLLSGLYGLAGLFGLEFAGNASMGLAVVFSAAVLACTVMLLCKLAAQAAGRGGRRVEALALLVCALCLPFYFYTPVFYTDAFAMFFLVAEAWLLLRFSQGGGACCRRLRAVAGLGVLMKGTLAVPVVALAISICFMGGLTVKKRLAGLAVFWGRSRSAWLCLRGW